MQSPCLEHFTVALRVIKYLQKHPCQGIFVSTTPSFSLIEFCDADWATCKETRRSMSGSFICLGGSPISWKYKKQVSISLSSEKAKYISMHRLVTELTWLIWLLADVSIARQLLI